MQRGISGLVHASKLDDEVWQTYTGDWQALVEDAERLLFQLKSATRQPDGHDDLPLPPSGPSEQEAIVRVRRGQSFFRRAVLSSYDSCCAVCGLDLPALLSAGHIIPWSERADLRLDPRNGMAFCALHDRAYDKGFMTVTPEFRVAVSHRVLKTRSSAARDMLMKYNGEKVTMPTRFAPLSAFLVWHEQHVYQ